MKSYVAVLLALSAVWAIDASAGTIDVIDATTPFLGNYFLPSSLDPVVEAREDTDYYRHYEEDWQWQHHSIGGTFSFAELVITAHDVDLNHSPPEKNLIQAKDDGIWENLGFLDGDDGVWADTTFTLTDNFFDDINTGLEVQIVISAPGRLVPYNFGVILEKSVLSVEIGDPPPTDPPPTDPPPTDPPPTDPPPTDPPPTNITVPAPGAILLCGLGAGLIGWTRRRW